MSPNVTNRPPYMPEEQTWKLMLLKKLHNHAFSVGGDAVNIAMGQVEVILKKRPELQLVKMYKGSLLTLIGAEVLPSLKKREYVKTGVQLMKQTYSAAKVAGTLSTDMLFVMATSMATLAVEFGFRECARKHLDQLIKIDDFGKLEPKEQVLALSLAACLAQQDGETRLGNKLFGAANNIDRDFASQVYFNCRSGFPNGRSNFTVAN